MCRRYASGCLPDKAFLLVKKVFQNLITVIMKLISDGFKNICFLEATTAFLNLLIALYQYILLQLKAVADTHLILSKYYRLTMVSVVFSCPFYFGFF